MFLPFQKCVCCGKRIGLFEWFRFRKKLTDIFNEENRKFWAENPNVPIIMGYIEIKNRVLRRIGELH